MAMHEPIHHAPKSLKEGAVCFSCAIGALAVAAVAIQWMMSFLA